jgi:hypothetical protein
LIFCFELSVKAGLHYGDYRSKLVHFEEQKNIFFVLKGLAYSNFRQSVNTPLDSFASYQRWCMD